MKGQILITCVILSLLGLVTFAFSQDGEAADVKALIGKLGDPDFKVRESAENELLALGEKAVPLLTEAAKSDPDTHIRYEADRLLRVLGGEKPLAEKRDAPDAGDPLREASRRFDEVLKDLQERGILGPDSFERLRELMQKGGGAPGLSFGGVMKGAISDGKVGLEWERRADGSITVKVTQGGESKTYEAESLDALKEAAPEIYEKVAPQLGGIRVFNFDLELPDSPFGSSRRFPFPRRFPPVLTPRDQIGEKAPGGFRLGVWVGEISEPLRVHLKLAEGEGILVEDVVPGSLADRSGVKRLDVIRAVNTKKVGSAEDVRTALADVPEGGKVEISVIRRGEPLMLVSVR